MSLYAGSLGSATRGTAFRVDKGRGFFSLSGTFVGTGRLERSYDGGTTWEVAKDVNGNSMSYTAAADAVFEEPAPYATYSFNCSAYTSGSLVGRVEQ